MGRFISNYKKLNEATLTSCQSKERKFLTTPRENEKRIAQIDDNALMKENSNVQEYSHFQVIIN